MVALFKRRTDQEPAIRIAPAPAPGDRPARDRGQRLQIEKGVPSLRRLIAPDSIDRTRTDRLVVGRNAVRSFLITALPRRVSPGWVQTIMGLWQDLDLAIHLEPYRDIEARDELAILITRLATRRQFQKGSVRDVQDLEAAEVDLWNLRNLLAQNEVRLWRVTITGNVYVPTTDLEADTEALENASSAVEERVGSKYMHMRWLHGLMDEGYVTTGPFGVNLFRDGYRNMDSLSLSTIFPFVLGTLEHEHGVPIGVALPTQEPVFYDAWDPKLDNPHMVIYAASGSGKSTTIKILCGRSILRGERVVVIDPEGEYARMAEFFGAPVVRLGIDPINIMDVQADAERADDTIGLAVKVNDLTDALETMVESLTPGEKALIEESVYAVYAAHGITDHRDSLYTQAPDGRLVRKAMPTLSEVYREIAKREARFERREVLSALTRYLSADPEAGRPTDGSMAWVDKPTAVNLLDESLVVFSLQRLGPQAKPLALQVALSWIWEHFAKGYQGERKRIVIDEAHVLAEHDPHDMAMRTIDQWFRRLRKRSTAVTLINQDFQKFVNNPHTVAIHQNCQTYFWLRQEEQAIAPLVQAFGLSKGEEGFLLTADKGQGILRAGRDVVALQVVPIEAETEWCFTKALQRA